ncbi:larval cuticle protein 65Ag1 [Drosophila sulfurigaster albostrigata]|uniref:larval cuticle protein 65Ag1 n=1 Tax=Drosophila sulfurigaster albostrigata TaxID=89887 RepID=UPI002D21AE1F|nr:larval cuticle protein 65Ag1 [Drosophila sulfurigaster albostrigata]
MKYTVAIVAIAFTSLAIAVNGAPAAAGQQEAQVVRYDSDVQPEGYKFAVETSDGKSHQEEGQLKHVGTDHEAIAVRGFYTYLGDDGQTYTVNYVADENGYQPEGEHLPRAVQ